MGASLLIAIGPQNTFVLTQGIKKQQVFPIVLICAVIDALLIAIGCAGVGTLIASNTTVAEWAAWGGAAFLTYYGLSSLKSAFHSESIKLDQESKSMTLKKAVALTLGFTILNPHVYLDTLVLIGSLAGQYQSQDRTYFGVGAASASLIWFFALGYAARWLAPLFAKPIAWRILDVLVALVMFVIAWSLVDNLF